MNATSCNVPVLEQSAPAADIRRLRVQWPDPTRTPGPGQFFMLRAWDKLEAPLLSRPISVHDFDPATGTLTFLYQIKGPGTEKLAALAAGDTLTLTGPCGNGFDVPALAARLRQQKAGGRARVAVVGGGIGTAPLLLLCKQLARHGIEPELYAGYRDEPYALEEFVPCCASVTVSSDSGAVGHHGVITEVFPAGVYDLVLACGPTVMMTAVWRLCAGKGVPCLVSLENKMACGLGACLGCTCHTKVGPKTVCRDGPVFDAGEVLCL